MKKSILMAAMLFVMNDIFAQTNPALQYTADEDIQVPTVIASRFKTDYPGIDAIWTRDGANYRADYVEGTTGHAVTYNAIGRAIGQEDQLAVGNYPSAIGDYYLHNYPDEQYEVWSNTEADGTKSYYTNHKSETLWFDKTGKYKNRSKAKSHKNS